MDTNAFLIVQSGPPHEEGKILPLKPGRTLIGRAWLDHMPDIVFDDPRISRSHAEISYDNDRFVVCDLPSSKHGTEINGKPLTKGMPYVLSHNDKIDLARGVAVLRFCYQTDEGETLDLRDFADGEKATARVEAPAHERIVVDDDRREVLLDGEELRPRITGREFELALLLYRNRGRAVKHEDIIDWVWEDVENRDTITRQDVNTLVHRLRRCLGDHGEYIVNISSYGYRLD